MKTQSVPQIGPVLSEHRKSLGLTLNQLAASSGVSKSMLSQIERAEVNPTFAVLWALTRAMNIDFSTLLEGRGAATLQPPIDIVRGEHTPEIRSADGLCKLRILSPPELVGSVEWYGLEFAPDGRLDSAPHSPGAIEHFTAETPGFEVTTATASHPLKAGDTARYRADVPHAIANRSRAIGRGYLVVLYERRPRKTRLDSVPV
jgi:XRE family transcriptional regulator, regulator of sulfur utilization